jgi:(2Fe-2S) ferredoxin
VRAALQPRLHLLVCTNAREGSPLGPGCGARGDAVYDALKQAVAAAGATGSAWVTRTHCLGICPKRGATVARYPAPAEGPIVTEVEPRDAAALLSAPAPVTLEDVARELDTL